MTTFPMTIVPNAPKPATGKRSVKLSDLKVGESARVLRVEMSDQGCRRRFAELGIHEGMVITVAAASDTLLLAIGTARIAISAHCAEGVAVLRIV